MSINAVSRSLQFTLLPLLMFLGAVLFPNFAVAAAAKSACEMAPWQWVNPLPQGNDLEAVAYGNGRFVAVGIDGTILTSVDGTTWERQISGLRTKLNAIIWGGAQFVAVGDGGIILTSSDGITWQKQSATSFDFKGIAWDESQFVAVGSSGWDGEVITSTDGVTWEKQTPGVSTRFYNVFWSGSQFIASGSYGRIFTSADGITWQKETDISLDLLVGVAWNGSVYVNIGDSGLIRSSEDGVTWQKQASGTSSHLNGIAWSGSQFVVVGNSGTILTSEDGLTWQKHSSGGTNALWSVAWGKTRFLAVGSTGAMSSTDGITWQSSGSPKGNDVTWNGTKFATVGTVSGAAYTNGGGTAWTELGGSRSHTHLRGVTWDGSKFVGVGSSTFQITASNGSFHFETHGVVFTSEKGVTWQERTSGSTGIADRLQNITWSGTRFVAVGWLGSVITSDDGIRWQQQTMETSAWFNDVAWGESQFVAVGRSGRVFTSADGITWQKQTSGTKNTLEGIIWDTSQFVAVGAAGTIITSPDGITWSDQTFGTADTLYDIAWSGSKLVAVGSGGTILVSSVISCSPVTNDGVLVVDEDTTASGTLNAVDGDGDAITYHIVDYPTKGILEITDATSGAFTYTPNANVDGSDIFTFKVNDGTNDSNTASMRITITPVNDPPVIVGQKTMATPEETALTITLPDLKVTDLDSDYPTNFTLIIHDGTDYTWSDNSITPVAGFTGTLTVPVQVNDAALDSALFDLNVTVSAVPVITGQVALSMMEEDTLTITLQDLTINDLDSSYPDDFSLVVQDGNNYTRSGNSITAATDFNSTLTVAVYVNDGISASNVYDLAVFVIPTNDLPVILDQETLTMTEGSSLTIGLSDLTVTDADNNYPTGFSLTIQEGDNYVLSGNTVIPEAEFNGNLSVPVRVNDGVSDSIVYHANITVTPINDVPVITDQKTLTTEEGMPLEITLQDLIVVDPDNIYPTDFTLIIQEGNNHTRTGNTITPDADFNGTLMVLVQVNDGIASGDVYHMSIAVTPVNDPPVANDGDPISVDEDGFILGSLIANDIDDDFLTYEIVTPAGKGTATIPDGNVDAFTYQPYPNKNGIDSFSFKVNDGDKDSNIATVTINITPINDPPTIKNTPGTSVVSGSAYFFSIEAEDPEQDTLTFTIANSPAWQNFSFDANTGMMGGVPSLSDIGTTQGIVISVSDGKLTTSLEPFDLTVHDPASFDATAPEVTPSVSSGIFSVPQQVTLNCSDDLAGCASIYYTLDGTEPTSTSNQYSTPLDINSTTTLKFFAQDNRDNASAVQSITYTIISITDDDMPPMVAITAPSDGYLSNQLFEIFGTASDSESGIKKVELQITDGTHYMVKSDSQQGFTKTPSWVPAISENDWTDWNILTTVSWTTGTTYTITARATDRAGNSNTLPVTAQFTITDQLIISGFTHGPDEQPLADVTITFDENSGAETRSVTSNAVGFYNISLGLGWSGTATPTKQGFTFEPENKPFDNILANQEGSDFSAKEIISEANARAIIVAGGGDPRDYLWEATNTSANFAYKTLLHIGIRRENIRYFNTQTNQDADGDGNFANDIYGPPSTTELEQAIKTWAGGYVNDDKPLLIYLIDHGQRNKFFINKPVDAMAESIASEQIDQWLDEVQTLSNAKVIFIYDACFSGSFLGNLKPPPGQKRINILSTGPNRLAFFASNGTLSFSNFFWGQVLQGSDLRQSFLQSRQAISQSTNMVQRPIFDANGDGKYISKEDGPLIANSYLGNPLATAATFPVIIDHSKDIFLDSKKSTTLWLKTQQNDNEIARAWAVVALPKAGESGEEPITDLPLIALKYNAGEGRFEGSFTPSITGHHIVSFYAQASDTERWVSAPKVITIDVGSDHYEMDDSIEQASIMVLNDVNSQQHTIHQAGDVDWVQFYALAGESYEIKIDQPGANMDAVLVLYGQDGSNKITTADDNAAGEIEQISWKAPTNGIYYVKVRHWDSTAFGLYNNYELQIYRPTAPDIGIITGIISGDLNLSRIAMAQIHTNGSGSALSLAEGSYRLIQNSGTFELTVTAEGYQAFSQQVTVTEQETVTLDISLIADGVVPVDTDADGIANYQDADDDNDGLPDIFENQHGLDSLLAADASQDKDGDGLTNLEEFQTGTNLDITDTDVDGTNDKQDAFPLNSAVWVATTSISGRVVDDNGAGLSWIWVDVHNQKHTKFFTANTDENGFYTVNVKPGKYVAVVWGEEGTYQPMWYNQAKNQRAATLIDVSQNSLDNINFRMSTGTSISGTITGGTSGNVFVSVWSERTKSWGDKEVKLESDGSTDFKISGLQEAKDYRLEWQAESFTSGFYSVTTNGPVSRRQATRLDTTNGNVSSVNITLGSGTNLTITVTGLQENETVDAGVWSNALNLGGWADAKANADGVATLIIKDLNSSGTDYRLFINSSTGKYKSGNYKGTPVATTDDNLSDGDDSVTEAGTIVARTQASLISMANNLSIKVAMDTGGSISGTVSGLTSWQEAWIEAFSKTTHGWGGTTIMADSNGTATYTINGLKRARDYRVSLSGDGVNGGFYPGTNNTDLTHWKNAAKIDIHTDNNNATDINLTVSSSVSISGSIQGPNGNDGLKSDEWAFVDAWSDSTFSWAGTAVLANVEDGGASVSYTLAGLASAADYTVSMSAAGYEAKHRDGVDASSNATGIKFTLATGGKISGNITNLKPYASVWLEAWSAKIKVRSGTTATADAAGSASYVIDGLSYGNDYAVTLSVGSKIYFYQQGGTATPERSEKTSVSVAVGTTENIDFDISSASNSFFTLSGTVSGLSDEEQIVEVACWSEAGTDNRTFRTGNGVFTLDGLVAGDYSVEVQAQGYTPQRTKSVTVDNGSIQSVKWTSAWNDVGTVSISQNTAGLDVSLGSGYSISGNVINGTEAVSGVWVSAVDGNTNVNGGDSTDANGLYEIEGLPTGSYTLSVWTANGTADIDVSDLSNDITSKTLTISQQAGGMSGTIKTSNGIARSGVLVLIYDADGNQVASTATDSAGKFTIKGLSSGTHTIKAFGSDDLSVEKLFVEKTDVSVSGAVTNVGDMSLSAGK